ncbi:hypothetical protein LTS18_006639 [Coniosporium uncinatum]|uniref:Uncharacterized protein n=1 Tax=Coniosporium uncinatum TaxID=93489 RepID=A0ACC3DQG1_9PEZI|nr:hypothetical protein LTS18_006639 [Coniosporium uncinatum]
MTGKEVESGANKRSTNSEPAEADDRNIEVDEKTSTNVTEPTMSNPRPTIHVFKHDRLRRVDLTSDTPKTRFHLPTSTRSNPSLSHTAEHTTRVLRPATKIAGKGGLEVVDHYTKIRAQFDAVRASLLAFEGTMQIMAETERKLQSKMVLHSLVTRVGFDVDMSDEDAGPEMEA